MPTLLIRNCLRIATMDDARTELTGGHIRIEGGVIAAVGAGPGEARGVDEIIDGSGTVALPGLVNTHHHLYQTLTRAYPPAQQSQLFDWLVKLYPKWARLDAEMAHTSATIGIAELLLSGCATTTDHLYLVPTGHEDVFDAEIAAAREVGIRFQPCRGSMSRGTSQGGLPPDSVVQDEDTILRDSADLVRRWHDPAPGAMVRISLAPCSPFSITERLMRETAELAARLGVMLHTHLAETLDEEAFCLEMYGCRPVELLERTGWMAPNVWLAHCVHLSPAEIAQLGRAGVGVAHCPSSNLRLASGLPPVPQLIAAGVKVGLGVDGSASNDANHLLDEARHAMLVARVVDRQSPLPARDALWLATRGGAAALGRDDIGQLAPGKAADVALFRVDDLAHAGALGDPVAALLFCQPGTVSTLVVNGCVVVRGGQLQTVDLPPVIARHNLLALRMQGE